VPDTVYKLQQRETNHTSPKHPHSILTQTLILFLTHSFETPQLFTKQTRKQDRKNNVISVRLYQHVPWFYLHRQHG